jgi:oligoribonuclease NrnB/cAMP/cGMP phosphodiesterase (DHH superfamily)
MSSLEERFEDIRKSMEAAETEYNQSTQCLVDALTGIHERMENIEKWIESQLKKD